MKLNLSEQKGTWYIVHYLKENFGDFSTYQPRKFKNSKEILARGSILAMYKSRKQLLEFKEYKGKVYSGLG